MSELEDFLPEFTIVDFPGFRADPARHGTASGTVIGVNFTKSSSSSAAPPMPAR